MTGTRPESGRGGRPFLESTKNNLPLIVLGGLFLFGAVCGNSLYGAVSEQTSNTLMFLLTGNSTEAFRFFHDWGAALTSSLSVMALLFLCGFCAIAQPIILAVPFIKGLGFGMVAACSTALLSPYSAFFWLKFLPGAFLSTALILLCARLSLVLSMNVFRLVFPAPQARPKYPSSGAYCVRYVGLALLGTAFSLADVVFDLIYEVVST